jgi:hypothetical protein
MMSNVPIVVEEGAGPSVSAKGPALRARRVDPDAESACMSVVREQVAVVWAFVDEIEQASDERVLHSLGEQLVEELTRLGAKLDAVATALSHRDGTESLGGPPRGEVLRCAQEAVLTGSGVSRRSLR